MSESGLAQIEAKPTPGEALLDPRLCRFARLALGVFLAALSTACSMPRWGGDEASSGAPDTTYRKFLARAEAGEAESQNVVGFMLFHGEGVRADRPLAQDWFRRSAEQGNPRARRNLAIMQSLAMPQSGIASAQSSPGDRPQASHAAQSLYERFCAGCHGFNGISTYVHSPSFALGESLHKGDAELLHSLLRGKGEMPNWDDKFHHDDLVGVLQFVRTLPERYQQGIAQSLRGAPPVFYLFGPMRPDRRAYREQRFDQGLREPR